MGLARKEMSKQLLDAPSIGRASRNEGIAFTLRG